MGQPYIEELNWLREEIAKIKGRTAQLDVQQKAWGDALSDLRQRNGTLKESLAKADNDLAKVQAEAQKETTMQTKAQESAVREDVALSSEVEASRREKSQLIQQLEAMKRQIAPILSEITTLNLEISHLQQDNDMKRNSLNDSEVLPKEVERLQARLERAMKLKPGLLQKIRFTEELFTELGENGSTDSGRLFADYKRLAKELESMKYEQ